MGRPKLDTTREVFSVSLNKEERDKYRVSVNKDLKTILERSSTLINEIEVLEEKNRKLARFLLLAKKNGN